jgi:hypothetical protein
MDLIYLILGIIIVVLGILFQIRPQTHIVFNISKQKAKLESKEYIKNLDNNKIFLIRILWLFLIIIGILLITLFFL